MFSQITEVRFFEEKKNSKIPIFLTPIPDDFEEVRLQAIVDLRIFFKLILPRSDQELLEV